MQTNNSFTHPRLISLVSYKVAEDIKIYAVQNTSKDQGITVQVAHTFIKRCDLLSPIIPTYIILTLVWIAILICFWVHTFVVNKQFVLYLQRSLVIIPVIKIFETLVQGLFLNSCPWINQLDPFERYIEMARISVVTITYTILLALLFLLSKGWNIVLFHLSRDQATNLTMIMAIVYLCYSAFFLSTDFAQIS